LAEWNVFVFEWALPVQVSGLSYRGATTVIIINSLHTKQRRLFTLAHEFAHVLFHLGQASVSARSVITSGRNKRP
jgi:Zn-dependent peptidase ImmA (M78 family)